MSKTNKTDFYIKKLESLTHYALENPTQGMWEYNSICKSYRSIRRGINKKNKRIKELENEIQSIYEDIAGKDI
jgi:hypothetical protein